LHGHTLSSEHRKQCCQQNETQYNTLALAKSNSMFA